MIAAIYQDRSLVVRDQGNVSQPHRQRSGVAQGCPLSTYFFVIVMRIIMADAALHATSKCTSPPYAVTSNASYADDTLIVGSDAQSVQNHFNAVASVGRQYGLELNMAKTVLLRERCLDDIIGTDGKPVSVKNSATYLGSMLSVDRKPSTELTRRLEEASRFCSKDSPQLGSIVIYQGNTKLKFTMHVFFRNSYTA